MKFGEKDIMDMASFVWIWSIAGGVCVGTRGGGRIQAVGGFLHVGESIRVCLFVCTCVSLFLFFFICLFVCLFVRSFVCSFACSFFIVIVVHLIARLMSPRSPRSTGFT